jgi:hypothetical protein
MMRFNPEERPSIEQIRAHPYFNGAVPSGETIITEGRYRKSVMDWITNNEQ